MKNLNERINEIFDTLVEELDLDYGNSYFDDLGYGSLIEAPNNTTLPIYPEFEEDETYTDEEIKEKILERMERAIEYFDPEETFEEIWSPRFEYSAFQFVKMLKEDEDFFNTKKREIRNLL